MLDRGEVVEQGTFADLMHMDRILATMLKDTNHSTAIHPPPGQDGGEKEMGLDKKGHQSPMWDHAGPRLFATARRPALYHQS